ncbi:MAG TPA: UDP-N-acetylmuramoyl-L-alanyl-D-glutamate--2,6-diaminopimelate ligase [Patescibacteria group bacterium]|nr:UDP-N-acetylmuramoyl-L-alanyl-D-glutamate--2,6-diaminopimelate ligase [Patescibacteria group bacterium]
MGFRTVVKKFIPKGLFPAIEPYGHLAEGVLFNTINGFPAHGMKVIGVTGTNGKTTTSFMIYHMLRTAGFKTGLMTTVAYGIDDDIRQQVHHMTSQPMPELMRRLKWMKNQGVEWLVLETTSQALAQNRTWGVPYSLAVMTNVTHEHLSFHKTFERYRDAKVKLFRLTNKNTRGLQTGIINAQDPSASYFAKAITHSFLYGQNQGDLVAKNVKLSPSGSEYTATINDDELHIKCNLPGSFNVENSLAAVGVGHVLGLSIEQIEQGIAALKSVEGRMTRIDEGQDFDVIVDYAHTPDSFEKLFKDLRPVAKGKIIALFGSLGGGDKSKRPLQGELAGKYADEVIVCEEDDRQEDPQTIMNDIAQGAEKAGKIRDKNLFLVHDRPQAIQFAIDKAGKGDTVLLLGKGHEKTIEHADGEHPWDEIATAHQSVKTRLAKT